MASQLSSYLTSAGVPFITIEHIGSTSIPKLSAKPNIDIVILVRDHATALLARDALIWQPEPTEYYKCIGDGGIRGRISMKHQDWTAIPQRSVYIISEDNEDGLLSLRGYRDMRECLTREENADLRRQYDRIKWQMVEDGVSDGVEYGQQKNGVVRKILMRMGWMHEDVNRKEALDVRRPGQWVTDDPY
ncbi:hypothetical protein DV735_g154, partial [Chaetothyriales sp. CBS 134920]